MVSFESICGGLLICVAEVSRLEPQRFVPDPLPTEALCALWALITAKRCQKQVSQSSNDCKRCRCNILQPLQPVQVVPHKAVAEVSKIGNL